MYFFDKDLRLLVMLLLWAGFVLFLTFVIVGYQSEYARVYASGFIDGQIVGVSTDIVNAEKYIAENCVCGKGE